MNADELVLAYHGALKALALANARAASMEENRKIELARQIVKAGDIAVSKAENIARCSDGYVMSAQMASDANAKAEEAKAEVEYLRTRWETWRTKMSMQKVMRQTSG